MYPTPVSPIRAWGHYIVVKDVYERCLQLLNLANSRPEETQPERLRRVYYTLSSSVVGTGRVNNMLWRGLTRVAYPGQGMREPSSGISEKLRFPRLSHFIQRAIFKVEPPTPGFYRPEIFIGFIERFTNNNYETAEL